jgi:NodT family efflux transporter outer membrane factor (OMF) lipoprotein
MMRHTLLSALLAAALIVQGLPARAQQQFVPGMDVPGQWWQLYHSQALNALIDEALRANPDVAAAQASLRSAREAYYAQRASAWPSISGTFSVQRIGVPTYYAPPLNEPPTQYTYGVNTAALNIAYTPDVFGNLRYQTLSAKAAALVAQDQTEATYLTLTSNVVVAAITAASLRDQIDATNRAIAADRKILEITQAQKQYAQAATLDVLNAETVLRQEEQLLPPLEKTLDQTHDLLARLLGRSPDNPPADIPLTSLQLPTQLPQSLPANLLDHRPDVAAASESVEQAAANLGVATTDRLPAIAITGQLGTQALTIGGLFGPGTLLWSLGAALAATLYDHGALKHKELSAKAAYDQAAAQYKGTVLSAYQNVADSIAAVQRDTDGLVASDRAERSARGALEITTSQLQLGQVAESAVLTAEQNYQSTEVTLVAARAAQYMDSAALFVAVGGGWWNRQDIPSP